MGKNLLSIKINPELGYPSAEIDKNKIISFDKEIYWIFGLIDRQTKDSRILFILNNLIKSNYFL